MKHWLKYAGLFFADIASTLESHLPIGTTIEQARMRIESFFENQQLQTSIQIENTIQHIYDLIL